MEPRSFKTRSRRMKTAWDVRALDAGSQWLITIGGIGTIVAVLFVFLFLLGRVFPLLVPASFSNAGAVAAPWQKQTPLHVAVDEYQSLGWTLYRDGTLHVLRLDTGEKVDEQNVTDGETITAASIGVDGETALGFANGSVRLGHISVLSSPRELHEVPEAAKSFAVGQMLTLDQGVLMALPDHHFRWQKIKAEFQKPTEIGSDPIALVNQAVLKSDTSGSVAALATVSATGAAKFHELTTKKVLGKEKTTAESFNLPAPPGAPTTPKFLRVGAQGKYVFLTWADGRTLRYDTRNTQHIVMAEDFSFTEVGNEVTALEWMAGQETLICGDSAGNTSGWFAIRRADANTPDGWKMERVHELPQGTAAVTCLGTSPQSRLALAGYEDGSLRLFHMTTTHEMLALDTETNKPIAAAIMPAKERSLWAVAGGELWHCDFEKRYPEATFRGLFLPVWYEGYAAPESVWQSSFAGAGSEAKLGLLPLIFGTFKATLYAILFGAPLAYLAAIYTSEFVHSNYKVQLKSGIELMASLPSVVLGFLAAIFFAPLVGNHVPSILAGFFTLPLALIVGAQMWQLLPQRVALLLRAFRLVFVFFALIGGVLLAWLVGPLLEYLLFAGDFKAWLDHQRGSGTGGWWLLLLPLSGLAVLVFATGVLNPLLRSLSSEWGRGRFAFVNFLKVSACIVLTGVLAWLVAAALNAVGLDPRGSLVGTYVQRNALVVGFVMGFAIIPIIYTLAEDALSTVPWHLRSASLGCGATPWQTAVRIVIPTAMSGLFSALMVGLGRAVGETMIVLMAGGNVPIFDINPFNGFRTLAANIAVELPEAAQYSTHDRTLYLSALVLFSFTFVVNTVAEMVRLRFRKRAYQL